MAKYTLGTGWTLADQVADGGKATFIPSVKLVDSAGTAIDPGGGVAQGSTTAGQTGTLVQGAVTTAAPAYTTAQTSPLSLTTGGDLRAVISNTSFIATGNVASGASDSGNPVKVGGVYNATYPTLTTGQRGDLQLTARGRLAVSIEVVSATGTNGFALGNVGYLFGNTNSSSNVLAVLPYTSNGASLDLPVKPNAFKRVASSAASGNPDFAKASAGNVSMFWGSCGATAAFLQLYAKASAPTVGTDVPVLTYPIPANSFFSETIPNGGAYFPTGIAFAFTTDAAGTTGSAAAAVTAFALLVA